MRVNGWVGVGMDEHTWCVPDGLALLRPAVLFKNVDGFRRAAHVAPFRDEFRARLDQRLGLVAGDLVLRRGREGDVDLADVGPGPGAVDVLELALEVVRLGQLGQRFPLHLQLRDQSDLVGRHALFARGDQRAFAVREGDDGAAEFDDLECGVLGDVAGSGDGDSLALEGFFAPRGVLDHVVDVLWPRLENSTTYSQGA